MAMTDRHLKKMLRLVDELLDEVDPAQGPRYVPTPLAAILTLYPAKKTTGFARHLGGARLPEIVFTSTSARQLNPETDHRTIR
jgi:hypothetical protein